MTIDKALGYFKGKSQLIKSQGLDDDVWRKEIFPALTLLRDNGLAELHNSNEFDLPTHALLTEQGKERQKKL